MIILNIETSTNICSIALSENDQCIFSKYDNEGQNHANLLNVYIQEALDYLAQSNKKLDAVAVSSGPGSYTGLRIGVSAAKGICYGLDIPLISISTLEVLTIDALKKTNEYDSQTQFCPMLDARRMEVYAAFYNQDLTISREISADIIEQGSYNTLLDSHLIYFFGNGMDKCKPCLELHPNARFIENIEPNAKNMISLSKFKYLTKEFVDTAYFEPFYLKEFHFTTPKPKF